MSRHLALLCSALLLGCAAPHGARRPEEAVPGHGVRRFEARPKPTDEGWLRAPPPSLPTRAPAVPLVVERRLSTGIRVLVSERHQFPSIGLAFVLDRGVCDGGTAATIYGRAFGSSPEQGRYENYRYLHEIAAPVNMSVSEDAIVLRTRVFPPLFASAVSRLGPMFLAPGLSEGDLEFARRGAKDALSVAGSRHARLAERSLREALFGQGAYGTVVVDPSEIDAESDAHVREFRRAVLSPRHVTAIVVGDIAADQAVRILEQYTAGLPRSEVGTSACAALPAPPHTGELELIDDPGAAQSRVHIGAVGVPVGHADGPALDVLTSALGDSLSSRLNLKIRGEHGYTYGVRMSSQQWRAHGLIDVATSVETGRTAEAVKGLLAELDRAATDPLDEGELARAKIKALPELGAHDEATSALLETAVYGLPAESLARQLPAVSRVTADDLSRVASVYLAAPRRVVTIVGDASRIAGALRELGLRPVVVQER